MSLRTFNFGRACLEAGPWAILGVSLGWLLLHLDESAIRYPIHYGLHGEPDRWMDRRGIGPAVPFLLGATSSGLMVWMRYVITRRGSATKNRASMEHVRITLLAQYALALIFSSFGLLPLWGPLPLIVTAVGSLIAVIGLAMFSRSPAPMPDDENPKHWRGSFYWNPNDPAIFVRGRYQSGLTLNLGRRASWIVMALFFSYLVGSIALVHFASRR